MMFVSFYIRPVLRVGLVLVYSECIYGSVQYSKSHCPVLLHVQLHFKLFIIGRIKMDGWMDGWMDGCQNSMKC